MRRGGPLLAGLALVTTSSACAVGDGSGSANGWLFVDGCRNQLDAGTEFTDAGIPVYELRPSFFAGEPIEDFCPPPGNCPGEHTNRLLIRMQRTGNRIEVNDTLYIDIENSVELARCIRGRTENGVPTWDTRMILGPDGMPTDVPFCDWGGDPAMPGAMTRQRARINMSTLDFVRASLAPLNSCIEARLVAVALPGSWIEFEEFGTAAQANLPAAERGIITGDFKVDFGERLVATFHLELGDQRVVTAMKNRDSVPKPKIGGTLDGNFNFDLARSRAAQPFP